MRRETIGSAILTLAMLGAVAAPATTGAPASPMSAASPLASASAGPSATPATPAGPAASASPAPIMLLGYDIVSTRPHDTGAWTEGLLLDPSGRLFESTGLVGRSSIREVDPHTGAVLRSAPPPGDQYSEGIALVGDRLIQLTWKDGVAYQWDRDTFAPLGTFSYAGEGWGLCYDGTRLVMSDGTPTLTFRDPTTFAILGTVQVTFQGKPLAKLNELECVDGAVWANVWEKNGIVRIDPTTGVIDAVLDARGLLDPDPSIATVGAWLNGIAYDPAAGTFLLTGKLWPSMLEVRLRAR